ncbi:hypothetical protein NW759_011359 [Fusarium solani]|nr:hypothetical protein NW759_011359 [Fusarium solani]
MLTFSLQPVVSPASSCILSHDKPYLLADKPSNDPHLTILPCRNAAHAPRPSKSHPNALPPIPGRRRDQTMKRPARQAGKAWARHRSQNTRQTITTFPVPCLGASTRCIAMGKGRTWYMDPKCRPGLASLSRAATTQQRLSHSELAW